MPTPEEIQDTRLCKIEESVLKLTADVAKIIGSTSTVEMILKFVVLPLLIILGGLVGIKIAMP
jgi:hypothetical protein